MSSEQLAVLLLCLAGCALNEQLCGGGRGNLQRESAHVQRAFSPCRYSNAANRSKNDARAQRYVAAPRSLHRSPSSSTTQAHSLSSPPTRRQQPWVAAVPSPERSCGPRSRTAGSRGSSSGRRGGCSPRTRSSKTRRRTQNLVRCRRRDSQFERAGASATGRGASSYRCIWRSSDPGASRRSP